MLCLRCCKTKREQPTLVTTSKKPEDKDTAAVRQASAIEHPYPHHRWLWNSVCTEKPLSSPWAASIWRRKASLLCQHCPCLEGLTQTLFFRTLNNHPVTPSQKFLITHPAFSDGLCLSALVHTLGRKLQQDRNWFISGSSILCCRAGDRPRRARCTARQHCVQNRALKSTELCFWRRGLGWSFLELSSAC